MPQSQVRRRKVAVLTVQGFQKLQSAQANTAIWNHETKSCTLEALSEQTGLSTHTLSKVHARRVAVDFRTLVRYFSAFKLILESSDYRCPKSIPKSSNHSIDPESSPSTPEVQTVRVRPSPPPISWGMAPDVSTFHGRDAELATLQQWILEHRCRLVSLVGMGGIGKTWLATKLAEQLQPKFKIVVWRSLQPIGRSQAPIPFSDFLDDLIYHLAPHPNPTFSESIDAKLRQLLDCLRQTACLLVLDSAEFILSQHNFLRDTGTDTERNYSANHEAYSELFKQLGQGRHKSCVILTSRTELKPTQVLAGKDLGVRSLSIQGLQVADIQQLFNARGTFQGGTTEWHHLVNYYGGNPLILGIVATTIQRLFGGSINDFLCQNTPILDDIGTLLDQQLNALSKPAQAVINVLATQDAPIPLASLKSHLSPSIPGRVFVDILESLQVRSLINASGRQFSLAPLLRDYMIGRFYLKRQRN